MRALSVLVLLIVVALIYKQGVADSVDFRKLETELSKMPNDTAKVNRLIKEGYSLANSNVEGAKVMATNAAALATRLQFDRGFGEARLLSGILEKDLGNYREAMRDARDAKKIFEDLNARKGLIRSNMLEGAIYQELGESEKAFDQYIKALEWSREGNDKELLALANQRVGTVYNLQNNKDKALEHLSAAIDLQRAAGLDKALISSYNLIADIYTQQGNYKKAIEYISLSKDRSRVLDDQRGLANANINEGRVQIKLKNYEEALFAYLRALTILQKLNDRPGIASLYAGIGEVYLLQQDYTKAIDNATEALKRARDIKALPTEAYANQILAEIYEKLEDYSKAYAYYTEYARLQDTLLNLGMEKRLSQIELQQNFDQNQEIWEAREALKQMTLEAELRRQKANSRRVLFIVMGFILLVIVAGLLMYIRRTYKSRMKRQEAAQEAVLSKEKERSEYLEKVDKLKDEFLANTSHELRTPLNGIIGIAEALKDDAQQDDPEKFRNNIELIISSGKRLSNLVNSILDFSKMKTENLTLDLRPLDLKSVVDVVLRLCLPLIAGKDLKLINDIPEDLPAVKADENRLQQILHNLVGNAIKFTESGEIKVGATAGEDEFITISISDTGIGIPADKQSRIFDSFEQVDASIERVYGGTGLGLAISKNLIELQEGKIWVESEEGKGSTFLFTLPKSSEEKLNVIKQNLLYPRARSGGDESMNLPKRKRRKEGRYNILIVDDEPINHQVLSNHLYDDDFRVVSVMNGGDALKAIEKEEFDLVLLDIMMPRMSGYEVCTRIREKYLPNELPIIIITARNQVEDLVEALGQGANDYLSKPFSKQEFLARVNTHLNMHSITTAYAKFVPREFLQTLGHDNILNVKLGDQVKDDMTILFSDIRGYTTWSESMTPEENFNFLNGYLRRVGPVIRKNNGFVNQYYGDGIMALYLDSPEDGLRSAIEMLNEVKKYNEHRATKNREAIEIGVGLHAGSLMLGILGDNRRLNPGVVSDAVNTSSRMEGLTKFFGANIIFTESVLEGISEPKNYKYRFLGKVQVVGKRKVLGVYECYEGDDDKICALKEETKSTFEAGLTAYLNKDFELAITTFQNVLEHNPDDQAAKLYLSKAEYCDNTDTSKWTGVLEMEYK